MPRPKGFEPGMRLWVVRFYYDNHNTSFRIQEFRLWIGFFESQYLAELATLRADTAHVSQIQGFPRQKWLNSKTYLQNQLTNVILYRNWVDTPE